MIALEWMEENKVDHCTEQRDQKKRNKKLKIKD